jgi:hypothetical protein
LILANHEKLAAPKIAVRASVCVLSRYISTSFSVNL